MCVAVLHLTVRGVDELARTGPDEFSVLLHATDAAARRLGAPLRGLARRLLRRHPAARVTCSIGIAARREAPTLLEVAIRARRRMEVDPDRPASCAGARESGCRVAARSG